MSSVTLADLYVVDSVNILQAMSHINKNTMGMVFIVDNDMRLRGVLSDGDVRRGLLEGIDLHDSVTRIMQRNYHFVQSGEAANLDVLQEFKLLPVVDSNHILVDFYSAQNRFFPIATPCLNGNELNYLLDAFLSSWISSTGRYITRFEESFAAYCGTQYGVSVFNGTVALHLALRALGIGQGDEVIVPDLTFAATINAVLLAGARPVIVDISEDSWCIAPKAIESALSERTKAIIPVHLYGQVCDMDSIMHLARAHKLFVIEDCAEAHGASFKGKKVGSFGDMGCFSFFGNKVITTGEGGMCVCNDKALNEKLRILRDHGMDKHKRYWHTEIGFNYRMTNLQAALGLAQLERIDMILRNRASYEHAYIKALQGHITPQAHLKDREKITWLASFLLNDIDRAIFMRALRNKGVDARAFFYPLSDMPIYAQYAPTPTPIAHAIAQRGINLPTYESLQSIESVVEILKNIIKEL